MTFGAQPSTIHHVERGVKLGARTKSIGKQELSVSIFVMCSNGFREFASMRHLMAMQLTMPLKLMMK
jgi:hypothetical protein